jgi:ASC-1-like (ASCH) protein
MSGIEFVVEAFGSLSGRIGDLRRTEISKGDKYVFSAEALKEYIVRYIFFPGFSLNYFCSQKKP